MKRSTPTLRATQEIIADNDKTYNEIVKHPSKINKAFTGKPYVLTSLSENTKLDSIIILANKLQQVVDAREEYTKKAKEYKELSLKNGVSEEAINYILEKLEKGEEN